MGRKVRVLLIGGGDTMLAALRAAAEPLGYAVEQARGLSAGLGRVGEGGWTLTLLSLEVAGADLALAARLLAEPGSGAVAVLSARVDPKLAMEAARTGILDVLPTSAEPDRLRRVLRDAASTGAAVPLADPGGGGGGGEADGLVGTSEGLVEAFRTIGRVGPSVATVLITGESGTGKELVAEAIHRVSPRATGPFVAVNCAAIPEDLLESELFGHERGAFTGAVARKIGRFERANRGTIFLDEIGDMSLVLQAKILRVLQEREVERVGGEERIPVDVRVIAATHRKLDALMDASEFREDLYYRLAVVSIELPPLRARGGDIRELALHYAGRFAREHGRPLHAVSEAALELLARHRWPGNVRELRNVIERAVLLGGGGTLLPEHIDLDARTASPGGLPQPTTLVGYSPELSMADVEALHMEQVLRLVNGHYGRAAELLGMHRNTVSRKAQEYGLAGSW